MTCFSPRAAALRLSAAILAVLPLVASAAPNDLAAVAVGDADSFGRSLIHLGSKATGVVALRDTCNNVNGVDACFVVAPNSPVMVTFETDTLFTLELPGEATETTLCHWLTVTHNYTFASRNVAGMDAGRIFVAPVVVLHSEVLNDDTLINLATGQPFNGKIALESLGAVHTDERALATSVATSASARFSRSCQGGLISLVQLRNLGLDEATAQQVLDKPIRLEFAMRGRAQGITSANLSYGIRLIGDR